MRVAQNRIGPDRSEPSPEHGELMVYRILEAQHAERAFSGEDAVEHGGRWSLPGDAVVYASGSLTLAVLEALVRCDGDALNKRFVCVSARIPPGTSLLRARRLPREWNARPAKEVSRLYGSRWLRAGRHAVLAVPSVVVSSEHNFLIDPLHPEAAMIEVRPPVPFRFDPRLIG